MLIPFFTFAVGLKWPILGTIISVGRICVLAVSIFALIFTNKIIKLLREPVFICILLYFVVLMASTYFNSLSIMNAVQLLMYGTAPFLVMATFWGKTDAKVILGGINLTFTILIFANLLIMLCFPEGIYQTISSGNINKYFLFGAKNQMVAPLIIGLCFFAECSYRKYGKLSLFSFFKFGICVIELLIGGSGTGLAITAIFFLILFLNKKNFRICRPNITLAIVVALFFLIVIFEQQNIFAFIIEDMLHKDITMSNRTFIWQAAIISIIANPWIGQGVSDGLYGNVYLKLEYVEKDTFAHDMYLDVMVMGGLVAMVLFLSIIWLTKRNYGKIHSKNCFLWWALWLYLVASLFDIYTGNYCMFIVMAYILTKKVSDTDKRKQLQRR